MVYSLVQNYVENKFKWQEHFRAELVVDSVTSKFYRDDDYSDTLQ